MFFGSVFCPKNPKKISQKTSKKYFIWHIRYVEGSKTNEDLSSAGNTGLLRPGGNLISLVYRVQFWRRVPDTQANLHGSAKNSQKKCRQKKLKKTGTAAGEGFEWPQRVP